ncbi:hypothetical protein Vretimale_1351 [Volvox reticuliferus]|uniref:Uncharacterized protein n=1 Tax=Volvox reticuliferus TaxID=1737510 RepID=A0A8J4D583_9CHLO|nr:hypothetical protein Vretifemale_10727 [Volvox reticuliferus]GIL95270.1 hypothetical protein Vretimale_1351 [Volvox reticuliferus]
MPHEEPIPPLDAILDGSGVRYYSKRTRQLTSLEKKLEAARDAFNTSRKEQGLPDRPKLFHRTGSPPARATATATTATSPVSSAALRRELRRQALEATTPGGGSPAAAGASAAGGASSGGGAASGSSGGGAATGYTARSRSGRDSDFQRFADSLVGSGRGPVVVAKPYHTEARTYFNLSLLPNSMKGLAADSGLYYSPVATMRGVPGPAAKGLREDSKFRYFHSELATEREEREQAVQMEISERLFKAQEALGAHIQGLVARWGPGFLERLTAAAAAEAAGEAGRSNRASGASATSLSAGGGVGGGTGGGSNGGRQSPLKLHLSAGGMAVPASAADAVYEFEHYRSKASSRPCRSSSPPPIGGTAGRLYGISDMRVSAATMERLSYLSGQLKVPVEQIMTLLRKSASPGDGRTSPASKRSGGGTPAAPAGGSGGVSGDSGVVLGMGGVRQSRRIELEPARRSTSVANRDHSPTESAAASGVVQGDALNAQVAAIMADAAMAVVAEAGLVPVPAGAVVSGVQAQGSGRPAEGSGAADWGEVISSSASAAVTTVAARYESQKSKHRHIHLVVAAAVAERDEAEARAKARAQRQQQGKQQQSKHQPQLSRQLQPDAALATGPSVTLLTTRSGDATAAPTVSTVDSAGKAEVVQGVTAEVPRTPVHRERPSALLEISAQPPSGAADSAITGGQETGNLTDGLASPARRLGSRVSATAASMHQVWSAFPSRRARSRATTSPTTSQSASPGPSPVLPRRMTNEGDGGDGDADGGGVAPAAVAMGSRPCSPIAYHHRSGLSYVALGNAMPAGPSLEGLQPVDPRRWELEAASRAALESLARRHGDSHRTIIRTHHNQNFGGGGSRAGSASTASRPGTSGGMGERAGGQSQRRIRSRPSGTGTPSRNGGGGGGGTEQRRPTVGGMSNGRPDDGVFDVGAGGGGALRFSERGSGGDDDCEGVRVGSNESGGRRRNGRVRSGSSRQSARNGAGGGSASVRRRGRMSPLSAHSHSHSIAGLSGVPVFGSGVPGSSGEEVIFATSGGGGGTAKQTPRRSVPGSQAGEGAAGGGNNVVSNGLRRLSDLAVSVGLHVGNNRSRRTSSPRSSGSAGVFAQGLLDSSDEDSLDGALGRDGEEGQDEYDATVFGGGRHMNEPWVGSVGGGGRAGSRPSTSASVNAGGVPLQLSWDVAGGRGTTAGAAVGGVGPTAVATSTSRAVISTPPPQPPAGQVESSMSSGTPPAAPVAAAAAVVSPGTDDKLSGLVGRSAGAASIPDQGLNPPSLSRHYKLAGSRWNPTAPGALRPGYGTESDYVAGTYNPDLMERVATARDTAALTGEEVDVDYKSPVQALTGRRVLPPPPLTQRQPLIAGVGVAGTPAALTTPPPSLRISLDLSLLTPAGRAAAANAKAALAIADVLNPVTRALTNTAVLAAANGSELPVPLQALAEARGTSGGGSSSTAGRTTVQLPVSAIVAANTLAQQLVAAPRSSRMSPDATLRRTGAGDGVGCGDAALSRLAAAGQREEERVVSRTMRPSQSVWGRAELDEHDILQPLNQHLASATWAAAAAVAVGPSCPRPTPGGATAAAGVATATAAERRAVTAPAGLRQAAGAPPPPPPPVAGGTPRPLIPEPRLWRGNPLDLKAAFPKGEKVYRLVTDVQANARLLREVEKDITPVEFRNRMRRGVVL